MVCARPGSPFGQATVKRNTSKAASHLQKGPQVSRTEIRELWVTHLRVTQFPRQLQTSDNRTTGLPEGRTWEQELLWTTIGASKWEAEAHQGCLPAGQAGGPGLKLAFWEQRTISYTNEHRVALSVLLPTHTSHPTGPRNMSMPKVSLEQASPFFISFSFLKILPVSSMIMASPFSHRHRTDAPEFAASTTARRTP